MNISFLLDMAAEAFFDRLAIGADRDGLTFGQLAERARRGAGWLASQAGERVVFLGLNSPALPLALFASAKAGKPFTPLNYRLADEALARLLERAAPAIAIVDEDFLGRIAAPPGVTVIPTHAFEAACAAESGPDGPAETEQSIAVLLFTSGTTGEPKAAVLRHEQLTNYVISTVDFGAAEDAEAALVSVPPYHIAGISAVLTGTYAARRTVYLSAFTPEDWVETAARERVTQAMVVPTMLGRILDVLEQRGERLPHLTALSYGGGRMPEAVIERALRLLPHVAFVNAYGLTETSSTIAVLGPEDHRTAIASDDPSVRRRLRSVGRPLPSVELEVRKAEGGIAALGEAGEIHVRGPQVAGEYLHKSGLDAEGWFATNDSGWLDEDGYLYVEGRLDDVIVRGGENLSPGEIEEVLRAHPLVADVAVVGVSDEAWGEAVAAVIVPGAATPQIAELTAWVQARLRSTKTPQHWVFRAELPYNETGKLLRRALKAELSKGR